MCPIVLPCNGALQTRIGNPPSAGSNWGPCYLSTCCQCEDRCQQPSPQRCERQPGVRIRGRVSHSIALQWGVANAHRQPSICRLELGSMLQCAYRNARGTPKQRQSVCGSCVMRCFPRLLYSLQACRWPKSTLNHDFASSGGVQLTRARREQHKVVATVRLRRKTRLIT